MLARNYQDPLRMKRGSFHDAARWTNEADHLALKRKRSRTGKFVRGKAGFPAPRFCAPQLMGKRFLETYQMELKQNSGV